GAPRQAHLPVLPRGLSGPRQRVGPVGRHPQTATVRGGPASGRNLSTAPEQRRGTRKRNPLSTAPCVSSATTIDINHEVRLRSRCASSHSKREHAALPSSQSTAKILDIHRYIFSTGLWSPM